MSLERAPLEQADDADQNWFAPIAMLIAWLAHLFEQIANLKRIRRTTKFKPNWREHWPDLRQCEWIRDQILASGAAQLLAGKPLNLDAFIPSTEPPVDYGGPCPKTPFEMNRRFLAIARFNADPEPAIRAHAKRIARREGVDLDNPLAAHGSTDATLSAAAHHELVGVAFFPQSQFALTLSSTRSVRPLILRSRRQAASRRTKGERGQTRVRGPPLFLTQNQPQPTSQATPARSHPHARSPCPSPPTFAN